MVRRWRPASVTAHYPENRLEAGLADCRAGRHLDDRIVSLRCPDIRSWIGANWPGRGNSWLCASREVALADSGESRAGGRCFAASDVRRKEN